MKSRRGLSGLWGLLALTWFSTIAFADAPAAPADPACVADNPVCSQPELLQAPGLPRDAQVSSKADQVADEIGALFAGAADKVGRAAQDALDATVAAVLAAGSALMAALRAYADFLVSQRPKGIDPPAWAAIVSGATGVAAAGAQTGAWYLARKLAPFLPLFSRIDKDELLNHDRRARLFEFIKQNPGCHLSEISRALELPWGSSLHHLRKLRADRLILFKNVGHHKCFFVNGSGLNEQQMEALSLVKGDTLQRIVSYIQDHPKSNLKDVAAAVQISSPLAAFHVAKLERAGLVQKWRDGKSIRLQASGPLPSPTRGDLLTPGPRPTLGPMPALA